MKPILVHLHIYYPHLYKELKECVLNITPHKFDLFVTMVEEHSEIISDIKETFPTAKIEIIENRGYDVGPFIHILNQVNLDDYDYVVKLHTKSDKPTPCYLFGFDASGDKWRKELTSFMNDWNKTISFIEKRQDVGMVAGANVILDDSISKYKHNHPKTLKIANSLKNISKKSNYTLVAGSMFLIKANLLKPIHNKFSLAEFERYNRDGNTLAHAFEWLFGLLVCYSGYIISDINSVVNYRKIINKIKHIYIGTIRFIYQKKVSRSGYLTIKILKLPIYRKRLLVGDN